MDFSHLHPIERQIGIWFIIIFIFILVVTAICQKEVRMKLSRFACFLLQINLRSEETAEQAMSRINKKSKEPLKKL